MKTEKLTGVGADEVAYDAGHDYALQIIEDIDYIEYMSIDMLNRNLPSIPDDDYVALKKLGIGAEDCTREYWSGFNAGLPD